MDYLQAALTINRNPALVKSDSFYPPALSLHITPLLSNTVHIHVRTQGVYYAVTSPDSLRQLCISVWLMRVISPKQQNDHFGGEHHRLSRLPVSPFSCFCGLQKAKMKRYLLLLCLSRSVCEASSGDKKYPYTLISVAPPHVLLQLLIIIWYFVLPKAI